VRLLKAVGAALSLRPVISRTVFVPYSPIRKGGIAAFGGCRGQKLNARAQGAVRSQAGFDCQPLTSEGAESSAIPRDPTLPKPGIARFKPVPGTGFSSRLQPTLMATRGALFGPVVFTGVVPGLPFPGSDDLP